MPTYDPKKKYRWDENTPLVTLTGMEFASLYHLVNEEMNQAHGAVLARKVEAYQVIMRKFVEEVGTGRIYEDIEKVPASLNASDDPSVKNLFKS